MKNRIMNNSVFQRKPSSEMPLYAVAPVDNSSKGSVAVSVRSSPPLNYQNLRGNSTLPDMNDDSIPYQIPQVYTTERKPEVVIPPVALHPIQRSTSGRSRPLPIPNHPPTSSLYAAKPRSRNPSIERVDHVDQRSTPPPHQIQNNPSRRPLPQPRPSLSAQSAVQPIAFASSTVSSISSFPSLTHSHSRSISGSTISDTTGITFPHSSSSYQTSFSTGPIRHNQSLDNSNNNERKGLPQIRPLAIGHSHGPASAPPRPPSATTEQHRRAGQGAAVKEVGFGRARMMTEPVQAQRENRSLALPPPRSATGSITSTTSSSRPAPLLLAKTPNIVPILPPLDFGTGISFSHKDFPFASPESAKRVSTDAMSSARYSNDTKPLEVVPSPEEAKPVENTSTAIILAPVLPLTLREKRPLPPPLSLPPPQPSTSAMVVSLPPPPASDPPAPPPSNPTPPSSNGSTVSLTPVPSAGVSVGPRKPKPALSLRTWDLDPPKKRRAKKLQVVQIQTLEGSEDTHDSHAVPIQEPPKEVSRPQPPMYHPTPIPISRPDTALAIETSAGPSAYANRTVQYLQSQPRPSFLPQCDDDIWKVGERNNSNGPSSIETPLTNVSTRSGRWSAITEQLKKLKITRRRSRSVGGWEGSGAGAVSGGGVFFKATSATVSSRPAFPGEQVRTSSLTSLDNTARPPPPHQQQRTQYTPKTPSFSSFLKPPTFRSASVPRTMEPSLRNEPTFLDPHPGRFVPRPSTTTPIGRPIGALWSKLRLNSAKRPMACDERIDLL